ncbi:deoxyribose-phosphate aldolase [Pseudomonas sp. RIT-To-2]|uniref:deoxyribose-phosphate aldolase n=1 Tax=Pseudomonas sp. RIT-To-2 TaxID=3462541 RepID=UPI004048A2DC
MPLSNPEIARLAISLLDLTSLNDSDDAAAITALCRRAVTPCGPVAAVCVYPRFVALARQTLDALGAPDIRVATVTNFPAGAPLPEQAARETRAAIAEGADEVDVVYPYGALKAGDREAGRALVRACREACGAQALLKVILETGELANPALIEIASRDAIAAGADFIKTSTGKVPVNATPQAARVMLNVIRENAGRAGFKPAGGVRTLDDARLYIEMAAQVLGAEWVCPAHLRLGASGVLSDLLRHLGIEDAPVRTGY